MQCPFCHAEIGDSASCCPSCGQYSGTPAQDDSRTTELRALITREAARANNASSKAREQAAAGEGKKIRKFVLTILLLNVIAAAVFYFMTVRPLGKYNEATELRQSGSYEEAALLFEELNDYRDSRDQAAVCRDAKQNQDYEAAVALFDAGKYEEAISAFSVLGDYQHADDWILRAKQKLIGGITPIYAWDFTTSFDLQRGELPVETCGDVQLVTPEIGSYRQVANFDGDGDYIACGNELNMEGDFTFSVTFYTRNSDKHYAGIFTKYQTSGAGPYALSLCDKSLDFMVTTADGSQTELKSSMYISTDSWYHADVVRKGNELTLYINGERHAHAELPADILVNADQVTIGRQALLHTPDQLQFDGQIADLTVYDQAIPEKELKLLSELRLAAAK